MDAEGISTIEPVDIEFAREFGCRIKLLAVSRDVGGAIEARVHPTMVPTAHLLASRCWERRSRGRQDPAQFKGGAPQVLLFLFFPK
ncbi:hypothetical protein [Candidatus Electronema sp. JC]|uniref:hypothetical protein n=1 Tax=Candidatus Electronema sp. JC TaxID=3401570 RepID=UPI003B43BE63